MLVSERSETRAWVSRTGISCPKRVGKLSRFSNNRKRPAFYGHQEREVFAVVLLDMRHRVLNDEELFYGTVDKVNVYPREVVKAALRQNADAIILAHNDPSGVAKPSQSNRHTERLDCYALFERI